MLIVAVAWFIQISESVYDTRTVTLAAIPDDARVLPLHLRAHTVAHLSSFAQKSNQQRERWKPIKRFLLHVVLSRVFFPIVFFFLRAQKSNKFVQHLQQTWQRSGNVDLGLAEAKMQGDAMAAIRYSLILTAANGRQTSKWLWRGGRGEDGELDGVVNNDIMGLFHKTEQFLQTTHFLCFLSDSGWSS